MSKRKIFVVGGSGGYANWMQGELVNKMSEANLVVFTGGTDVNPAIYGKRRHPMTQKSDEARDAIEKEQFELALAMRIPIVGICRGSQFLCAMAGGLLVQHQRHPSMHIAKTFLGVDVMVTSDHHQRQHPFNLKEGDYKILTWTKGMSPFSIGEDHLDDMKQDDGTEVEDCFYSKINALGIQSHPEWIFPTSNNKEQNSITYHRLLLDKLCEGAWY